MITTGIPVKTVRNGRQVDIDLVQLDDQELVQVYQQMKAIEDGRVPQVKPEPVLWRAFSSMQHRLKEAQGNDSMSDFVFGGS